MTTHVLRSGMSYGTTRVLYVELHSLFTTLLTVQWKNLIFFCPFSSLFHPCVVVLPFPAQNCFFFLLKKHVKNTKKLWRKLWKCSRLQVRWRVGTRPVPPWPKDYDTVVSEMYTTVILKSTPTDDTRTKQGDDKALPVRKLRLERLKLNKNSLFIINR